MPWNRRGLAAPSLLLISACGSAPGLAPPAAPLSPPTALCGDDPPREPCRSAARLETWLRDPKLAILGAAPTPAGTQGAKLLTVAVPSAEGRLVFRAKWRPQSSASLLNEPRKELGAYAVQKLFLAPHEYVVPPTVSRCFELARYRKQVDAGAAPDFPGLPCVFGILSYWLEDVAEIEDAEDAELLDSEDPLDEELFETSPRYRRSVANLNLVTYLIRHGDAHGKQFLVTREPGQPRLYTVDNSVAFESLKNPLMILRGDWSTLHVPALPRDHVERLSTLGPGDWASLAVIEQFRNEGGQLVPIPTSGAAGPKDAGMRWVGEELQVGLTDAEIAGVAERAGDLRAQIREREIRLF